MQDLPPRLPQVGARTNIWVIYTAAWRIATHSARIYPRSELSPTGFTNRTPKGVQISPHGGREVGTVLAYLVCSVLHCFFYIVFGWLVQADHGVYNIPDVKFAILISNTQRFRS